VRLRDAFRVGAQDVGVEGFEKEVAAYSAVVGGVLEGLGRGGVYIFTHEFRFPCN